MKYVVPQEFGAFRVAVRNGLTLAGIDPATGLIAAPGGGMKAADKCLNQTQQREGDEEHGPHLKFLLGSSLALYLYVDIGRRMVVTPQQALHSAGVKLHRWVLAIETSGGTPQERRPKEFSRPDFYPPEFFHDRKKLRPSFAYALRHFQGKALWPKVSVSGNLLKLNAANERLQLTEMNLHPHLIESLVPECVTA